MTILDWNGNDVPEALQRLPAGRYALQRVDELPSLTSDEEDGLAQALASVRGGHGIPHDQMRARILGRTAP